MEKNTDTTVFRTVILDTSFAKRCISHLRDRAIHRQFAGYLCICEAATLARKKEELKPAFRRFFNRFLLVGSPPHGTPYLIPFNESGGVHANVWLNSNVAGSYAPSSIRSQAPLRRVVDTFGTSKQATFTLRENHEESCLEYLLFNQPIDPLALAGFLFRDHSFSIKAEESMSTEILINSLYSLLGFGEGGFDRGVIFEEHDVDLQDAFSFSNFEPQV
jgi:hypothetical protein